jgi:hypothetical protein
MVEMVGDVTGAGHPNDYAGTEDNHLVRVADVVDPAGRGIYPISLLSHQGFGYLLEVIVI